MPADVCCTAQVCTVSASHVLTPAASSRMCGHTCWLRRCSVALMGSPLRAPLTCWSASAWVVCGPLAPGAACAWSAAPSEPDLWRPACSVLSFAGLMHHTGCNADPHLGHVVAHKVGGGPALWSLIAQGYRKSCTRRALLQGIIASSVVCLHAQGIVKAYPVPEQQQQLLLPCGMGLRAGPWSRSGRACAPAGPPCAAASPARAARPHRLSSCPLQPAASPQVPSDRRPPLARPVQRRLEEPRAASLLGCQKTAPGHSAACSPSVQLGAAESARAPGILCWPIILSIRR